MRLTVVDHVGVFCHPAGLTVTPRRTPTVLQFHHDNDGLALVGPAPCFVAMAGVGTKGDGLPGAVIPPGNRMSISVARTTAKSVDFRAVGSCNTLAPHVGTAVRWTDSLVGGGLGQGWW